MCVVRVEPRIAVLMTSPIRVDVDCTPLAMPASVTGAFPAMILELRVTMHPGPAPTTTNVDHSEPQAGP